MVNVATAAPTWLASIEADLDWRRVQAVTRRGKPAVVVPSATAYRHPLAQTKRARGAIVVTADVGHFEPTGERIEHPFASPSPARN